MPQLGSFRYGTREKEYELSIGWDDEAFAEGAVSFDIEAKSWPRGRPEYAEPIKASIRVEASEESPATLVVEIQGKEIARIPFADLFDESQIIDRIPAFLLTGEPITGCLVRSGISACVGQIIKCKNETQEAPWMRARMRAIGQCLRHHIPDMCGTAALRAALCVMRAGF